MFGFDDEVREAVRMVRAAGHKAQLIQDNDDSIMVMRMETLDRPTTGEWVTILATFYDRWLDGDDNVPSTWADAFKGGDR